MRSYYVLLLLSVLFSCTQGEKRDKLPDLTRYIHPQIGTVHGRSATVYE